MQEFKRSTGDPNHADPASQRTVFSTDVMPRSLHVGGHLAFGPDGMLYVSTGDGDDFGNPDNSSQRLDSLRGKLLRVDPRAAQAQDYTVPAGNPYPALGAPFNLIYAQRPAQPVAIRVRHRRGQSSIGDPGQSRREEIDYSAPGPPAWRELRLELLRGIACLQCEQRLPGRRASCARVHTEQALPTVGRR